MAATPTQALAFAEREASSPSKSWFNRCQEFVRTALGLGGKYGSAKEAYAATQYRHTGTVPPAGAPVWWSGGQYGHVALSAGGGYVWTNDFSGKGQISKVKIDDITKGWNKPYLGWSEDINDQRVVSTAAAASAPAAGSGSGVTIAPVSVGDAGKDLLRGDLVGAAGELAEPAIEATKELAFKSLFGVAAVALVTLGMWRMFSPQIKAAASLTPQGRGAAAAGLLR